MVVRELVVVETKEAQKRDVKVADVGLAFHGIHAEFIRCADGVAGVAAAAGEPDGHGVGVVIASIGGAAAYAVVRSAAKLATPDDERAL